MCENNDTNDCSRASQSGSFWIQSDEKLNESFVSSGCTYDGSIRATQCEALTCPIIQVLSYPVEVNDSWKSGLTYLVSTKACHIPAQ